MLDRYLEPLLIADATLVALLPALTGFESDGTTPRVNIYRGRKPQSGPWPFILILPPEMYDGGATGHGVSGCKFERVSICIVGSSNNKIVDPIRDRIEALINPLRAVFVPSSGAAHKVWVHYVMIDDTRYFTGKSPDGGEEQFPQCEIPLRIAYKLPAT